MPAPQLGCGTSLTRGSAAALGPGGPAGAWPGVAEAPRREAGAGCSLGLAGHSPPAGPGLHRRHDLRVPGTEGGGEPRMGPPGVWRDGRTCVPGCLMTPGAPGRDRRKVQGSGREDCWAWVHPLGAPPWPSTAPTRTLPLHWGLPRSWAGAPQVSEGCMLLTRPGPTWWRGHQSSRSRAHHPALRPPGPPLHTGSLRPKDRMGRPTPLTQHPRQPLGVPATGAPAPPGFWGAPWPKGGHWRASLQVGCA